MNTSLNANITAQAVLNLCAVMSIFMKGIMLSKALLYVVYIPNGRP